MAHRPCLLITRQRCQYFEDAVLPLAKYKPIYVTVSDDYWGRKGLAGVTVKSRFCGCGAQLEPRRRMCAKCAVQRRKDAYRATRREK